MCDHIECHGGKMKVYRVSGAYIIGKTPEEDEPLGSWWEAGFPDGWFPVGTSRTWQGAMDLAWGHIRND